MQAKEMNSCFQGFKSQFGGLVLVTRSGDCCHVCVFHQTVYGDLTECECVGILLRERERACDNSLYNRDFVEIRSLLLRSNGPADAVAFFIVSC